MFALLYTLSLHYDWSCGLLLNLHLDCIQFGSMLPQCSFAPSNIISSIRWNGRPYRKGTALCRLKLEPVNKYPGCVSLRRVCYLLPDDHVRQPRLPPANGTGGPSLHYDLRERRTHRVLYCQGDSGLSPRSALQNSEASGQPRSCREGKRQIPAGRSITTRARMPWQRGDLIGVLLLLLRLRLLRR
jgi:hypothetical protein